MYISKIEFDAHAVAQHGLYGRHGTGLYAGHRELWALFSDIPDRKRDFLYRQNGPTSFLTVSAREPADKPFVRRLVVKPYQVHLRAGEHIAFSLRINPVIKRRNEQGRQLRVDLVQNERLRLLQEGATPATLPRRTILAQNILPGWLARHDIGLDVEPAALLVESYGQRRFRHPTSGQPVTLACLDVQGRAKVRDPEVLLRTLYKGVGCAKGFGFGLLLVRRL